MELLERFTRGEIEAFETLFQRHQADVYHWVVCLIRDPAAAEDLPLAHGLAASPPTWPWSTCAKPDGK